MGGWGWPNADVSKKQEKKSFLSVHRKRVNFLNFFYAVPFYEHFFPNLASFISEKNIFIGMWLGGYEEMLTSRLTLNNAGFFVS